MLSLFLMDFGRYISKKVFTFFILLAMAYAQIAVSTHAIIHPHHDSQVISYNIEDTQNERSGNESNYECSECLLAKSLQGADVIGGSINSSINNTDNRKIHSNNYFVAKTFNSEHNPRAPPFFLI